MSRCIAVVAAATLVQLAHADIFLIGNSLTNDSSPGHLPGASYHIDCGKSLQFIYDNPESPCVASSTLWPQALAEHQFDVLSVQPYTGTTLAQDVTVISTWMEQQPGATVLLHTGWPPLAAFEATVHGGWAAGPMVHNIEYFNAVCDELLLLDPDRTIIINDVLAVLDRVHHDTLAGIGPYSSLADLYRDPIHLTYSDGYYLAHNTMRRTLGLPFHDPNVRPTPEPSKQYIRAVITNCGGDLNRNEITDVFDLLLFLDDWFAGAVAADRDGNSLVDVFDLLAFLDVWFAPC